jgi:heme-degrading monooxygenase HmoA
MLARVFSVTMKPDQLETAIAEWPRATGVFKGKGLIAGYMLLMDRKACKVMSVTLWESEAAIERNLNSPELKNVMAHFRTFFASEPKIEQCEVPASVV